MICSLLATCKAQQVNPREWLNDVIAQLPGYLEKGFGKEVKELLPNAWKIKKSNETPTQIYHGSNGSLTKVKIQLQKNETAKDNSNRSWPWRLLVGAPVLYRELTF